MSIHQLAGWGGAGILGVVMIFQLLLALGLPLGKAAWGGKHHVLPRNLRIGSAATIGILAFAAWMLLARADLIPPGSAARWVRILAWVFTGTFGLNVLMNLASKSRVERGIMTPISVVLVACYLVVLYR